MRVKSGDKRRASQIERAEDPARLRGSRRSLERIRAKGLIDSAPYYAGGDGASAPSLPN